MVRLDRFGAFLPEAAPHLFLGFLATGSPSFHPATRITSTAAAASWSLATRRPVPNSCFWRNTTARKWLSTTQTVSGSRTTASHPVSTTDTCILALLGIAKYELETRRLPLPNLARVAHRDLWELERISYDCDGPRHYRILGHPVALYELRGINDVSLCPECVRSAGFVEAHWDLELMTGCPVHRTRPLSHCPNCHLGLRWLRPGQLECKCGAEFTRVQGPILPEDEAELLDIIRRKVLGLPVSQESTTGIPISQLSGLSLRGLLSLIRTLARFHLHVKTVKELDDTQAVVTAAAYVLRSFPANFHALLGTIGEQHVRERCGSAIKSQFNDIYRSIFQFRAGEAPETRDFLGSAFLDFAINQWGRGVVDSKLLPRLQKGIPKRMITRAEFGKRFGIGKRTLRRVLAMKKIRTITLHPGKKQRTFIDLQHLHEPPRVPGNIFTLPTAAAAIGIGVRTLSKLRASGHFEVKHLITQDGYHERDIKQFIERLLALNPNPVNKTLPGDCITLHQALCRYHGTGDGTASIIRALLSGELRVGETSTEQSEAYFFLEPNFSSSARTSELARMVMLERVRKSRRKYVAIAAVSRA